MLYHQMVTETAVMDYHFVVYQVINTANQRLPIFLMNQAMGEHLDDGTAEAGKLAVVRIVHATRQVDMTLLQFVKDGGSRFEFNDIRNVEFAQEQT